MIPLDPLTSAKPPRGVYFHRKSSRYYLVVGTALGTEDTLTYVVYKPLYDVPNFSQADFFVRPLASFLPRFEYVGLTIPFPSPQ